MDRSSRGAALKEELDAAGGSGFRSGTCWRSWREPGSPSPRPAIAGTARAIQNRLSGRWPLDDLFPQAADLPEDIQDAELPSKYSGVGGSPFQHLIAEIERQLEGCAALR